MGPSFDPPPRLWKNCGKLRHFSTEYKYLLVTWGVFPQFFHRNFEFSTVFPQVDCQGSLINLQKLTHRQCQTRLDGGPDSTYWVVVATHWEG